MIRGEQQWMSPMSQTHSMTTMLGFIRLKCKSDSGAFTHIQYFHTSIGHQSTNLNPTENLWDVRLKAA